MVLQEVTEIYLCSSWAGHLGWDPSWVLGAGPSCHPGTCTQRVGRHLGSPSPCGYQRSYPSLTGEPDGCSSDNPTRLCLGRVVTRLSGPSAYDFQIRQHPKCDSGSRQSSAVKPGSWRGPCWRRQVPNLHARASLQELYHETCRHVNSPSVRQQLAGLLVRRQRAFAHNHTDLGSFNKIKHEINTNGAAPVREQVRHTPRGFEGEEKCHQEQLQAGVIWHSSDWAAPTVLVRKFDWTVRWCIDYRSLNDCSVKDANPLLRIDMCFDSLGGVRYFSTLELQSGYWQIKVEEADIRKAAFITKYGLFECIKMPFGLCSTPSAFQRCMWSELRFMFILTLSGQCRHLHPLSSKRLHSSKWHYPAYIFYPYEFNMSVVPISTWYKPI